MKHIYSIRDVKAGVYNTPFVATGHPDAVRSFGRAASDPLTNLCMYPEDFELFYLGSFTEDSGEFNLLAKPQFIVNAISVRRPNQPQLQQGGKNDSKSTD